MSQLISRRFFTEHQGLLVLLETDKHVHRVKSVLDDIHIAMVEHNSTAFRQRYYREQVR